MSEVSDWIRLTATAGIGCQSARKLLLACGLPEQIFSTDFSQLRQIVSEKQAQALCLAPTPAVQALVARTEQWCTEPGNGIITLADPAYPTALLNIPDPPILLYVKGRPSLLSSPALAVVGSRTATAQGLIDARQFSAHLSQAGLTVISGLASGIDGAAHQGALLGPGATVAVIGTGIDIIYPARNQQLARQIATDGCLVSEYPLGTPPLAQNFPRRNRLISGLALGVLVIEAAAQSGSLITARMALEQGREVFAIPGSIHSPLSRGGHLLIKQGAKLVETAADIIEELAWDGPQCNGGRASTGPSTILPAGVAPQLLEQLGFAPVHCDELAQRCQMEAAALSAQLVLLELAGQIEILAGGLVRRLASRQV